MKKIIVGMMVFLAILLADVGAKAQVVNSSVNTPGFVFSWMQDVGGDGMTHLTTTSITNVGSATVALLYTTTYNASFVINNGDLSIDRQNIIPFGPGATTRYSYGPTPIGENGTTITFETWLNSSKARQGSSESIYNIQVNGISLSETVTADWDHPSTSFTYTHFEQITSFTFDYLIQFVDDGSETGVGVTMLSTQVVPEPGTTSFFLLAIGITFCVIIRRKKIKLGQ